MRLLNSAKSFRNLTLRVVVRCGPRYATAKKYTKEHEAVAFDDETGLGTVMITDYAQSSLGDVVFVELTEKGEEVKQGGMCYCLSFPRSVATKSKDV